MQGGLQKKNVLVVVSIKSQFPELYRLVRQLKETEEFNPIVYFNLGNQGTHAQLHECLESDIEVVDYFCGYIQSKESNLKKKTLASLFSMKKTTKAPQVGFLLRLKFFLKSRTPKMFQFLKETSYQLDKRFNFFSFFYRVAAKLKRIPKEKSLLIERSIKLMIFAEDNEDYFTPQLIRLGQQMKIKSVVFPYTFANQFEFLEEAYLKDRRVNRNIFNFIAGRIFPKWTYFYKGKNLLKSYPSFIFSSELFRTSPPNPWVMSSGFADVIAVESLFMKNYYREAGIPVEKMVETGSPSLDSLFETHQNKSDYKKKLAKEFGLDLSKPWILCALPPYQKSEHFAFQNYDHFLKSLTQFFFQFDGVELIFKFHPRFEVEEIQKMCERYGVKFISEDTLNMIAVCDFYVASVSSTMRWALALGIPTINFDVYNFNYGDFDSAENYHVVNRMEDFKNLFSKLYKKLIVEKDTVRIPPQVQFAQLDGQSRTRVLRLLTEMVGR